MNLQSAESLIQDTCPHSAFSISKVLLYSSPAPPSNTVADLGRGRSKPRARTASEKDTDTIHLDKKL